MSIHPSLVYLVLVGFANLFTSSATLTPSILLNPDLQVEKASSLESKLSQDDIRAGQLLQPEAVLKEPHGQKRILFDLNQLPEESELLEDSQNPTTTSNAAASTSSLNPSKKFRPTVGSEDSIQPASNLHHILPLGESLSTNTDTSLGARDEATVKSPVLLVPPADHSMAAQPGLSGHIANVPLDHSLGEHSHMANIRQDISVQKKDVEGAQTLQNSDSTASNTHRQILSQTRPTDRWEDINAKKIITSEDGARSIGKMSGFEHKSRSDNDGSSLSRGPQTRLEEAIKIGGDGDSALESQRGKAKRDLSGLLEDLRSTRTEDKNSKLAQLLKETFGIEAPEPAGQDKSYQGETCLEQVIFGSPYETFRRRINKRRLTFQNSLELFQEHLREHIKNKGAFSSPFEKNEGVSSFHKTRIRHELVLVLGIAEFQKVEGHESIAAFFSQVYKKGTLFSTSPNSAKLPIQRVPDFSADHRNLTPHQTSEIRMAINEGLKIPPAEIMSMSILRDKVIRHCGSDEIAMLGSALDATMIFFYFHRYAQLILIDIGAPVRSSLQESQTNSINFVIEFWDKFLSLDSPIRKVYNDRLLNYKISMNDIQKEMKHKRSMSKFHYCHIEVEWAYILLKLWLFLDPVSRSFSESILPQGQNRRNFTTFMKSQAFVEFFWKLAQEKIHDRKTIGRLIGIEN